MSLKTRTKVLTGVVTGVAVALLIARSMLPRPVPYRFLEGAEFQGTQTVDSNAGLHPPMPPRLEAMHEYRIVQACEQIVAQAELELSKGRGWKAERQPGAVVFRRGDESVVMILHERSVIGKRDFVEIGVFQPAMPLDRVAPLIQYQLRLAKRRRGGY